MALSSEPKRIMFDPTPAAPHELVGSAHKLGPFSRRPQRPARRRSKSHARHERKQQPDLLLRRDCGESGTVAAGPVSGKRARSLCGIFSSSSIFTWPGAQVRVHRLDANLGPRLTRAEEQAGLTTRHFELAISSRPLPGPHSTPSFGVEWGFPRMIGGLAWCPRFASFVWTLT